MKSFTNVLALFTLLNPINAHYLFGRLIFENKWTGTWEYVREVSPKAGADENLAPIYPNTDPTSLDLRCGRNATLGWSQPKSATVTAGSTVGFAAGEPRISGSDKPRIYHPGFGSAWLSKSTAEDLDAYDGSGDWFKILSIVNRTEQSVDFAKEGLAGDPMKAVWGTYMVDSWNFTIPATTPPGKYLLRFEHVFPNKQDSQFYVNCAHLEIVNPGTVGTPAPLVKIPGVYERGQPDVYFSSYDVYLFNKPFTAPKPGVWTG